MSRLLNENEGREPVSQAPTSGCLGRILLTLLLGPVTVTLLVLALASGSGARASVSSGCQVSGSFPWEVLRWCDLISSQAAETSLSPNLLAAIMLLESGGDPNAYSRDGAVGLMQVMPQDGLASSFNCKGGPCFQDRPTLRELQDPAFNVRYGAALLQDLLQYYNGNLREALKAYGPVGAGYSYADSVLGIYREYGPQ